ncbi:pyruvate kinase 1 [Populus alba x Populus x berolinensis]|nr:pyruvate kinase 1 [Populus alba x Populus x berolinensis]
MAGKPAVDTRVVDSMTENLRPTRAEATDVATAILDASYTSESIISPAYSCLDTPFLQFGSHAILLGAETLRGLLESVADKEYVADNESVGDTDSQDAAVSSKKLTELSDG